MKNWYVAHTHPRAEVLAKTHLERQEFGVYLPRHLKRRRHARRVETVMAPLFPGYLFVAIDLNADRWRAVHSTVGVHHLICSGDMPAQVPDAIIDEIRARQDENGMVQTVTPATMKKGQPVQIIAGAFNGYEALFECASDRERIVVLLQLLGRSVRMAVPLDTVTNPLA